MFNDYTYLSVAITVVAIEIDKFTHFTHPGLQFVAYAGMLGVILSLTLAA